MKKIFMTLTLLFSVFFVGINGTKAANITLNQIADKVRTSDLMNHYNSFEGYTASVSNTDSSLKISVLYNGQGEVIDGVNHNLDINYTYNNGILEYVKTDAESADNAFGAGIWFTTILDAVIELHGYNVEYIDLSILNNPTLEKDGLYMDEKTETVVNGTISYPSKIQLNINNLPFLNSLVQKVDETTKIGLYSNTNIISKDIKLNISKLADTDETYKKIKNTANSGLNNSVQNLTVYNIDLLQSNQKVQPNGNVTLTLPIPEGFNVNKMAVYRMEDSGNLTRISHKINNGKIEIETNHFSNYAIVEVNYEANMDVIECPTEDEEPTPTPEPTEEVTVENPETGMGLHYGILGLIILVGCGTYIYMKKYNKFPMR